MNKKFNCDNNQPQIPKKRKAPLGQYKTGLNKTSSHNNNDSPPDTRIDKFTFYLVILLLLLVTLPLIVFPEQGKAWVSTIRTFMTDKFGIAYLSFGFVAIGFIIFIVFSDIGKIKLGKPEEIPEFKDASWAAMMFCAGIGATILYWGLIEWAYYYQAPPYGLEPGSAEAIRWATTYGMFHWGPIAWAIYLIPAVPIAYFYYVRKTPVLKVSQSLMPLLGEKFCLSRWGRLLDVFFVLGMIGGAATALGLVVPLINEGLHSLFNVPRNIYVQLIVLLSTTLIFGYSAYQGLKGGIQKLSNLNLYIAFIFLLFVLIVGPTVFLLSVGLESVGRMLQHLPQMMAYVAPFQEFNDKGFEHTTFPKDWTVFYWAWWLVYSPTIGLFIARISRGRTIRNMVVGSMFYGTVGCAIFFIILGNYGLYLELTDQLDVISILNNESATAAIFAILETLPLSYLVVILFTVLAVIFTATTYDSVSYILASVVQKEVDDEPHRWNRLFWAFMLCLLPAVLMFMGDLETLQTASVFTGTPLIAILIMMMLSIVRAAKYDLYYQIDYDLKTIHIEEVADNAPWEEGETSEAPEGSVLHQQETWETMREEQKELDEDSNEPKL